MDEQQYVALPFYRGRWGTSTAIVLPCACMHGCMGKYIELRNILIELKIFCASPLALCMCCGDLAVE